MKKRRQYKDFETPQAYGHKSKQTQTLTSSLLVSIVPYKKRKVKHFSEKRR